MIVLIECCWKKNENFLREVQV